MRNPSHVCNLPHNSRQCQILNPLREARDRTYILMHISQICFCCATTGTLKLIIFNNESLSFICETKNMLSIVICFLFLSILGPYPLHMEVPRLGSNWSCSRQPTPQPQQRRGIPATSATYTTAHGNAGSLTHCGRPGIEPVTS